MLRHWRSRFSCIFYPHNSEWTPFIIEFCCKKQNVMPVCLLPNSFALNVSVFFPNFFHKNHDLSFALILNLNIAFYSLCVYHASYVKDIQRSHIQGCGIVNIFHSLNVVVIFFDNCCYFVLISKKKKLSQTSYAY